MASYPPDPPVPPAPGARPPVVLRWFHGGRDPAHRARDRALAAAGVRVVLAVPSAWPEVEQLTAEPFEVVEFPVRFAGSPNVHRLRRPADFAALVARVGPDVVDVHAEPFGAIARQILAATPAAVPVVCYQAQNLDKRFPPPFHGWERAAYARLAGLYPCSAQAASVARGKGFTGPVRVVPIGTDTRVFTPGGQRHDAPEFVLALAGRLVPNKGVVAAVEALAAAQTVRPTRLLVAGAGPEETVARARAAALGVADRVEWLGMLSTAALAAALRRAHVLLVPSRSTRTWSEQFGRVVTEGAASGAVPLSAASGALPEVVGDAGVLTPEGDDDALARAAAELAQDAAQWTRLAGRLPGIVASWEDVASAQIALYDRVRGLGGLRDLGGSGAVTPAGRAAARAEFGPPARISGDPRPFALPVLREDTAVSRGLARAFDAAGRVGSAVRR